MTEEAKRNQEKWNKSEEYFQKEFPDHEDGCLYGKIVVKAAYTAGRESREPELTEAKEIIREYLKATESWNYDFADVLKCNNKAEAFLKEIRK